MERNSPVTPGEIPAAINKMIEAREMMISSIAIQPLDVVPEIILKMREEESARNRAIVAELKNVLLILDALRG